MIVTEFFSHSPFRNKFDNSSGTTFFPCIHYQKEESRTRELKGNKLAEFLHESDLKSQLCKKCVDKTR